MKRILSFILILSFVFAISCGETNDASSSVSYLDIPNETDAVPSDTLKIACSAFAGNFNPFYASYESDKNIVDIISVSLVTFDFDGNVVTDAGNEKVNENESGEAEFVGISNIKSSFDKDGNDVIEISLRKDVRFSDGNYLDIDDVIFSMYVLSDPQYDGPSLFNTLPICGMMEYQKFDDVLFVSGIEKIDSYSMKIHLCGTDYDLYEKLSIAVAPLHYYGVESLYDYEKSMFGFVKGKLDFLSDKSSKPIGAGPYSFVSYKDGLVKLERNEYYFNGIPNSKYVELIEMNDSEMMDSVSTGKVHIATTAMNNNILEKISVLSSNSNIKSFEVSSNAYGYIGLSATNVLVGGDAASNESKSLRKAFAILFSAYKYDGVKSYFGGNVAIEYPINSNSSLYPRNPIAAFAEDIKLQPIYGDDMSLYERYEAALNASIEYFIDAGYIYDNSENKFVKAADGASLVYEILMPLDENNSHPSYKIALDVKYALSTVGITLNIVVPKDIDVFWDSIYNNECDMWAAGVEYNSENAHLLNTYHSNNNKFGLCDETLDNYIENLQLISNDEYKYKNMLECFQILREWAVEVPLYDSNDLLIVDSDVIDLKSLGDNNGKCDIYDIIDRIKLIA